MNTGERLIALSGLPSGSALAHFAAITQQVGGSGQTIFAHRCDISVVETSLSVLRKAKNPVAEDAQQSGSEIDSRRKAVHVFTRAVDSVRLTHFRDEITVMQTQLTTAVRQKLMVETIKKVRNG